MKRIFYLVLFIALSPCFTGNASANMEFTINIHLIKEKKEQDKTVTREEKDFPMAVELGDTFFSYTRDNKKYIFDFAGRRIFTVDLSDNTYTDDSLFSNIGFRTYEFQNRLMLSNALDAGGIEDNPMLPALSEHIFSILQKDKKSELSRTLKDDFVFYSAEGKGLMSYSKKGTSVSGENKDMFIKFFRYVFGGHPQIIDELSSDNIIPGSIRFYRYNAITEDSSMILSEIKTTPERPYSLEGCTPGVPRSSKDPFTGFLHDVKYSKTADLKKHLEMLISKAEAFYKSRAFMDTMLVYLEYNLCSGLPFPPAFNNHKTSLVEDKDVTLLISSINPRSKEEAEKSIPILEDFEKKAGHYGHVIKIFEANIQTGLRNSKRAKEIFYEVLRKSPHITGVYKDLGDIYYSEYNAVMAWRCWDTARKIAPDHKMLDPIKEFELKLLKGYPEFF